MSQDAHPFSLDRYVLRRILGQGSMGAVYAAWDPRLRREVAIKRMVSNMPNAKGQARFEREAQAIAAIHHPNVVQVYEFGGNADDEMYLVMEKLDGADLFALMQRNGMMPEAIAVAIGHELCLALEAAHNVGIIHRDLKPENVFLTPMGRVVLTDFGIVKAVEGDAAIEGYREKTEVIGTPGFMAPEHMQGRNLGPGVDLFALGALMYNVATLQMPFAGSSPAAVYAAAAHGQVPDPRQFAPLLSSEFVAILRHCLTRDPRKRPKNARMLRVALQGILEDLGVLDVREDLRDYALDPSAMGLRAQRREAGHVAASLKIARQDGDQVAHDRLMKRMGLLEPDHPILASTDLAARAPRPLGGVWSSHVEMLKSGLHEAARVPRVWPRRMLRLSSVAALVMGVAVGALAVAQGKHRSDAAYAQAHARLSRLTLPMPHVAARAPAAPATAIEVEVTGASDADTPEVWVDGYPLAGAGHYAEAINPGQHLLEVCTQKVKFRRHVVLGSGDTLRLVADVAHKLLMVR